MIIVGYFHYFGEIFVLKAGTVFEWMSMPKQKKRHPHVCPDNSVDVLWMLVEFSKVFTFVE